MEKEKLSEVTAQLFSASDLRTHLHCTYISFCLFSYRDGSLLFSGPNLFFFCIPSFVYFSTQRFACSIPAIILSLSFPLAPLDFPFLLDHSHQHIKRLWNSHKIQTFLRSHILPAPHQLLNCFSPFLKYPSCHILALPSLLNTLLPGSVLPVYQTPFGIW